MMYVVVASKTKSLTNLTLQFCKECHDLCSQSVLQVRPLGELKEKPRESVTC